MPNILVDALPSSVEIDGEECAIDTDYRTSLMTILAFEDGELTQNEKTVIMLDNLYFDRPDNLEEAVRKASWFLNAGKENEDSEDEQRLYSFSQDSNFIYSAFRQTHGIDLQNAELHWWQFMALFMDTGKDTTFSNLVSLRKRVYSNKATKEEKQAFADLGKVGEVQEHDDRTPEEKEKERVFQAFIEEGKRKK